jgi:hypothetical protein
MHLTGRVVWILRGATVCTYRAFLLTWNWSLGFVLAFYFKSHCIICLCACIWKLSADRIAGRVVLFLILAKSIWKNKFSFEAQTLISRSSVRFGKKNWAVDWWIFFPEVNPAHTMHFNIVTGSHQWVVDVMWHTYIASYMTITRMHAL